MQKTPTETPIETMGGILLGTIGEIILESPGNSGRNLESKILPRIVPAISSEITLRNSVDCFLKVFPEFLSRFLNCAHSTNGVT